MLRTICGGFIACTLCIPTALHAQASEARAAADAQAAVVWQGSPQAQAWLEEARQLQQRMQPLQQRAMQDTSLRRMQREATSALSHAMREHDAEILDKLARMGEILEEAAAARAAGDEKTVAALEAEMRELQPAVAVAQAQALSKPGVRERMNTFESELRARMLLLDPSAAESLRRLGELEQQLRDAQFEPRI